MSAVFVQPKVVRINLTCEDGAYIDVKQRLNAGQERRVFGRMVKTMQAGEKVALDPEQVGISKMLEYLVGWSFESGGESIAVSEEAVNNLDPDVYHEIRKAIDAHEESVTKARDAEKNARATASAS